MDSELLQRGFVPEPLTPAQCSALDNDGFLILEDVIAPDWLVELRHVFDEIFAREGDTAGAEVARMEGVRRLADLVNKGTVFDAVYLQPALLTAVFHVLLRPFKLHSLNGHDPLPGSGLQGLHKDWGSPTVPGGPYHVVNSMWMLDDFTRVNGATRLRPRQPPQTRQNRRPRSRSPGRSSGSSTTNWTRRLGRRIQWQPLAQLISQPQRRPPPHPALRLYRPRAPAADEPARVPAARNGPTPLAPGALHPRRGVNLEGFLILLFFKMIRRVSIGKIRHRYQYYAIRRKRTPKVRQRPC